MRSRRSSKGERDESKGLEATRRRNAVAFVQAQCGVDGGVPGQTPAGRRRGASDAGTGSVGREAASGTQVRGEKGRDRGRAVAVAVASAAAAVLEAIVVAGNQTGRKASDDGHAEVFRALGPNAAPGPQTRAVAPAAPAPVAVHVTDHGRFPQRPRAQVAGFQHRRRYRFAQRQHGRVRENHLSHRPSGRIAAAERRHVATIFVSYPRYTRSRVAKSHRPMAFPRGRI